MPTPPQGDGDGLNIAKTGQEPDWWQLQKQHVYNGKMIKMALPSEAHDSSGYSGLGPNLGKTARIELQGVSGPLPKSSPDQQRVPA